MVDDCSTSETRESRKIADWVLIFLDEVALERKSVGGEG